MSNQTIWTGNVSNIWSDASNWTKGIPSIGIHAFIPKMAPESTYPVLSNNLKVNFTLKNEGELLVESTLLIQKNGILQNYGTIKTSAVGNVVNEGNIMNFGEWINEGTCDNKRIFTNNHRLFNDGLFDNKNTFVNLGNTVNTGVIDNHMSINNSGSLENFNIIQNHGTAEIYEKGFFPEGFTNDFNFEVTSNENKKSSVFIVENN